MIRAEKVYTALLEIVEVDSGKVVLRRADGQGEPLIEVQFSPETLDYIDDSCLSIAKAMIEAGIAAVANGDEQVEFLDDADQDSQRTIH